MTEVDISVAIDRITKLLEEHVPAPRREKISKMFEAIGEFYFTAPASSKKEYHSAYDGGLAVHSLNVFDNLVKLNKAFSLNFSTESMLICCLFHDLGKAVDSTCTGPNYTSDTDAWEKKRGILYKYSTAGEYFPNHQKSMFILQKYGVDLTDKEYQAILLNDGMYLEANKAYAHKQCDLSLYLHMADMAASVQEKQENLKQ